VNEKDIGDSELCVCVGGGCKSKGFLFHILSVYLQHAVSPIKYS
jgi:hypothetical protein